MDHLRGLESQRIMHTAAWQVLTHAWTATHCDDEGAAREHAQALHYLQTLDSLGGGDAFLLAACYGWADVLRHACPGALPETDGPNHAVVRTLLVDEDGTQLAPETLGPAMGMSTVMLGALLAQDTDQCKALIAAARASDVLAPMIANIAYALCSLAAQMGAPVDWLGPVKGFSPTCTACSAAMGHQHRAGCEQGWCRGTGRPMARCTQVEHLAECEPAVWDGHPHGTIECMDADFYRTWKPGQGWTSCPAGEDGAVVDVDRLWRRGRWDPAQQMWSLPS